MTDAAGAAQGVRREVETAFKGQAERILNSMDVVQREEFEAVRAKWPLKARAENKALAARIEALEAEDCRAPARPIPPRAGSQRPGAGRKPAEKIIPVNFSTKRELEKRFAVNRLPASMKSLRLAISTSPMPP